MNSFLAATAIAAAWAGFLSMGTTTLATQLEDRTRAQCANRDWPAHQAEAHEAFCRTYLD